ncbi:MAG: glycine cleavage system aminomethyltransferase GcvT [Thermomicrobiales bacterium]|nr:glycine cleavage system aminomethyltransferase GcvT [Thermomicrobiales bacterium]
MGRIVTAESSSGQEQKTPLYDRHVALGARMIPFAGWIMPVQYSGIINEHRAVRTNAGLFDLGHMGQVDVAGPDALAFLQHITTNDVATLEPGKAHYSLLPNEAGGVVDDIIIYRRPSGDGFMVCINASNRHKDVDWMHRWRATRSDLDVSVRDISDETGMIAIQGPHAAAITQRIADRNLLDEDYFSWTEAVVGGVQTMAARTGYTGEDGFEFYTKIEEIGAVWDALMAAGASDGIAPIGLGARDTLRLEARMPLYGNELADDINPLEAGLGWAVKLEKGPFVGSDRIAEMKEQGPPRRTVGFKLTERAGSPRSHFDVHVDGRSVGFVTSGAMSPTLNENIGLALVERDVAGVGRPLQIIIRDKPVAAIQVRTPFYKRDR